MKIDYASDIHLEFMAPFMQGAVLGKHFDRGGEVLVLAGDIFPLRIIDTVRDGFQYFCDRWERVVYVPGNHEFYGTSPGFGETNLYAVQNEISNLSVLRYNRPPISIKKHTFWGGTMWFPDGHLNKKLESELNDFRQIHAFKPWCYLQNAHFRNAYRDVQADVVVTHHLPSLKSVPARYQALGNTWADASNNLNAFFVSDMEKEMNIWQPKFWIHGHTHDPCDYMLGDTRVVCNPLGYPGEFGPREFSLKTIEL